VCRLQYTRCHNTRNHVYAPCRSTLQEIPIVHGLLRSSLKSERNRKRISRLLLKSSVLTFKRISFLHPKLHPPAKPRTLTLQPKTVPDPQP
jgi:hypothetical protein